MTATGPRCLQDRLEEVDRSAQQGDAEGVRTQLANMLRCSSRLTCDHAVPCSDDAMRTLRRVLGGQESRLQKVQQ